MGYGMGAKRLLLIVPLLIVLVFSYSAGMNTRTFERDYTYHANKTDSRLTAYSIALSQLKLLLLEDVKGYIKSTFGDQTKSQKHGIEKLTFVQFQSITAGHMEMRVLEEKWDGSVYYLRVQFIIDVDEVRENIIQLIGYGGKMGQLEEIKQSADAAVQQIMVVHSELLNINDIEKLKVQNENQKKKDESAISNLIKLGNMYLDEGSYDMAIGTYLKVLKIDPNCVTAYGNMGTAFAERGDEEKAISCFEQAAKLGGQNARKYIRSGSKVNELKDVAKSGDDELRKRAQLSNKGESEKQDARVEAQKKKDERSANNFLSMGNMYLDGKNYSLAIKMYEKVLSIDPKSAMAYGNMGIAYAESGDEDKAASCFQQAAALGDENAQKYLKAMK